MTDKLQSQAGWKWYGFAGHHICGARCQYHLTTSVNGAYLVSTVGRFVPDPLRDPHKTSTVGSGRDFETFVFAMSGDDENGDPIITSREPVDTDGYATSIEAERGHYAMCEKWAALTHPQEPARVGGVPEGRKLVPMTDDQVWHNDTIMSANGIGGFKMDAVMRIVRGVEKHHAALLTAAPQAPAGADVVRDADILNFMTEHRVAVTPEFEGCWDAAVYGEESDPDAVFSGASPREAVIAAMSTKAGGLTPCKS